MFVNIENLHESLLKLPVKNHLLIIIQDQKSSNMHNLGKSIVPTSTFIIQKQNIDCFKIQRYPIIELIPFSNGHKSKFIKRTERSTQRENTKFLT